MKRAKSQSGEEIISENDRAVRTKQPDRMLPAQSTARIQKLEKRRQESNGTEDAGAAAAQRSAEKTKHSEALVDLRMLAMKMGDDYQQKMMEARASAHASKNIAPTGKTVSYTHLTLPTIE